MSRRILTKLPAFAFAFMLAWGSANVYTAEQQTKIETTTACMIVASNLPRNHSAHPCHSSYQANKSWLSWLSGDSRSAHFQFLDLVELIQSTADAFSH